MEAPSTSDPNILLYPRSGGLYYCYEVFVIWLAKPDLFPPHLISPKRALVLSIGVVITGACSPIFVVFFVVVDGLEPPRPKDLIYSQASQPIAQHHNLVVGRGFEPL